MTAVERTVNRDRSSSRRSSGVDTLSVSGASPEVRVRTVISMRVISWLSWSRSRPSGWSGNWSRSPENWSSTVIGYPAVLRTDSGTTPCLAVSVNVWRSGRSMWASSALMPSRVLAR